MILDRALDVFDVLPMWLGSIRNLFLRIFLLIIFINLIMDSVKSNVDSIKFDGFAHYLNDGNAVSDQFSSSK